MAWQRPRRRQIKNRGHHAGGAASSAFWLRPQFERLEARQLLSNSPDVTLTGLNGPTAVAFDSHGDLFVANASGTTVSEFTPGSTTPSATLNGVSAPTALAFDTSGNLYVANNSTNTVSKFAPGGTTPIATLLDVTTPQALAFDKNGNLFVADDGVGHQVSEFAAGSTVPTATLNPGDAFSYALAFDSSGDLFVANHLGNVVKFTPGSTTVSTTLTGVDFPSALAFDSHGNLFVANSGGVNGNSVSEFAVNGTTPTAILTGLTNPTALAFDASNNLYVANQTGGNTVSEFAPGSTTATNTLTGLSAPAGLAFDPSGNLFVSNSFTVDTVSEFLFGATQLLLTTQPPATVAAGGTFGLTVTAENGLGQVAPGFSGSITLALASNPGSSSLSGTLIAAALDGVATFSGLKLNKPASGYLLQVSSGTLTSATSNPLTVTPGAATQLLITTQPPATVSAGSNFGLTVTAEDSLGNIATGYAGSVTVALAANPGSSTLGGTLTAAVSSGVATFSSLSLNKAASGYTLKVTSGALTSATSSPLTVTPGAATQLVITAAPPATVAAGSGFGLTVAAEDSLGNLVAGYAGSVTVALFNNPGPSTLGGTLTASTTGGVATFSNLSLNKAASGYTLQIAATSLPSATSGAINVTPGTATQFLISSQPPGTVVAGAPFVFAVQVEDALGNVAAGFTGNVTVALANNPGSSTLGGTVTVAASSGIAVFSSLSLNKVASGYTLQVSSGTLTAATSSAVTVTPGSATQWVITTQPATVAAGSGFGLSIAAEDSVGNIVLGYSGSATVALASNPGSSTLGGTLTASVTSGVASFSGLNLNKTGSGYTLQIANGTLASATSNAIAVTPGATTQFLITTQPVPTVTAGSSFGLTVVAEDALGNLATGFTGSVTVALVNNPGSSTLGGTATVAATSGTAKFSGLNLNKVGAGYTLEVASGSLTMATSSAITVTPGAATQLVITTQPATVAAGTGFGLTVSAEDAEGNAVAGFTGGVTVALANNPGSSTLGGTTTATATSGVAIFTGLTLNKVDTGYTLSVVGPSLASATASSINVIPGAATQFIVSGVPTKNFTAGAPFGFTVTAEDAAGNLATGFTGNVSVALATNPGSSTLGGTTTLAAASGVAVFSGLALNNAGTGYELSLASSGLSAATAGPINVTALGVATHLVIETAPPSTVAPGAAFGVTIEAEDDFGTVDTSFTGGVTIALANNPATATLSGTLSASASAGVAAFSGLSLNNPGLGYTLQATSSGLTAGTTNPFNVAGALTINGTSASNSVQITFVDATDFQVVVNGGAATTYSTATITKVVYNGPSGAFSGVVFDDPFNTYTATQSFASTDIVSGGFEFDANNVVNLYIYVSSGASTATINVSNDAGGSNFYVGDSALDYSYIGDPATGSYSELSGFASETITGSGGTTYAYIYSTSHGALVGDPGGSTYTASGFNLTLNDFPQVYAVGAADGTDTMTLHTEGGSFVGQPSFSYVNGTFNGASFLIGALFAANVTTQATHATDQAFFYSYAGNTFNGAQGTSSLTGGATGFASFSTFVSQATGFQAVSVLESGTGTDVANLTSPGNGAFTETASASTLAVGGVTVITVNTFFSNNGALVAVPSKVNIAGGANDTANLYDTAGTNSLVAQGNKATLTTPVNTVGVTQFGKVNAFQQSGTTDTVHQQFLDFALQTVGNWTSD